MRLVRSYAMVLAIVVLLVTTSQAPNAQNSVNRSSAAVLSEHEIELLDGMSPQNQAELLLERSINHFRGANEQIMARVDGWRGKITLGTRLTHLFTTAINSDDLTVRAVGIEIDLAARDREKSRATVDQLEPIARSGAQGVRVNALWDLGMLGNRGVEPDRIGEIILGAIHDPNPDVRYWAVESLAYLGTDRIIAPLLDVFHDDPVPAVRERAACGLAQSGMLNEQQRRTAVPRLLDFAEDFGLDTQTRGWVYQALRDITGQTMPPDARVWRNWYASSGNKN